MAVDEQLLRDIRAIRENAWTFDQLAQQLASSVGVIPFVGAGLSKPLGFPLWSEFLRAQAELAGITDAIEARLAAGAYEEAAEDVQVARGTRRFEDAILSTFGAGSVAAPAGQREAEVGGAVALLPFLAAGPVITTNFDRLLERVFRQASRPFEHQLHGAQVGAAVQALNDSARLLIKLHGDHADREQRVLTVAQYAAAYGSADPMQVDLTRPLPRLLRLVLQTRPLLFVGCSLNQDRTVRVLARVTAEYPELSHYAIVEQPAAAPVLRQRDKFLSDHGIRPIWYPPGCHEAVQAILARLVDGARQGRGRPGAAAAVEPRRAGGERELAVVVGAGADPTPAVRASLEAAGYPSAELASFAVTREIRHTQHSRINVATLGGRAVVVKQTRREICSQAALERLRGRVIAVRSGELSTRVCVPDWVGATPELVVEVQPYCAGIGLDRLVRQSPSRVRGALLAHVFKSLMEAVHEMHVLGVLHRDVSPSNVLVAVEGGMLRLTLTDCSFAWSLDTPDQIPVRNDNYTAPEQIAGAARAGSDWYGVAGTCYFLANGTPPDPSDRAAFDHGIGAIDMGSFDGGEVVQALLAPDPERRPRELWDILPRESSQPVFVGMPLVGVLDLDGDDFVFMREHDFQIVPRAALARAADEELRGGRVPSTDLRRQLERLAAASSDTPPVPGN